MQLNLSHLVREVNIPRSQLVPTVDANGQELWLHCDYFKGQNKLCSGLVCCFRSGV